MKIDGHTLDELELLASRAGGPGVLDLSDGPVTSGGRDRLADLLAYPPSDPAKILSRQRTLTFLADDAGTRRLRIDPELVASVRAYQSMPFVTLRRRGFVGKLFEALWTGLRYPDLLRSVKEGTRRSALLLDRMVEVCGHLRSRDPPPHVAAWLDELAKDLDAPPLPDVRRRAEGTVGWRRRMEWDRRLRHRRSSPLDPVLTYVYELDALVGLAGATVAREGWSLPEILAGGPPRLEARGLRHPGPGRTARNDLVLGGDHRVVVLTGPNSGGKTRHLKACAIAVVLSHAGAAVPATSFRFTPLAGLHASFAPPGDPRRGIGSLRAEALRLCELLEAAVKERRVLLLLNEPFRSTSVESAREATRELVRGLASGPELLAVVATHLGEPGMTDRLLGLEVLEREGFFDLLGRLGAPGRPSGDDPDDA